jgi:UDP-2,4-diacetamido-2,4,6-trideoxy-beta-L-altropyranose hydrolase
MVPALAQRHRWRAVAAGGSAALEALFSVWREGADLAIVDHYAWAAAEERLLRPAARRLAVIDDLANRAHDCDLLVDQNAGRIERDYAGLVGPQVPLLVGPRFAMLRRAFGALRVEALARRAQLQQAGADEDPHVLVSMGLSDPGGIALRACETLARLEDRMRVDVAVAASAASHVGLEVLAARDRRFAIHTALDADGMASLMLKARLSIGGGGGTSWERCALGLPALVLVLAENQHQGAAALADAGAALVFEASDAGLAAMARSVTHLLSAPHAAAAMSQAGFGLVDGRGTLRVASACEDLLEGLTLRVAGPADGERIWRWRNAPAARAASRSTDEIALGAHIDWYGRAITDPGRVILIGHAGGEAFGMVRFDATGEGTWDVSIALDPSRTGRGLGTRLLRRACAWLEADRPVRTFSASARETNASSLRAFSSCGFSLGDPSEGWVSMTAERGLHGTA